MLLIFIIRLFSLIPLPLSYVFANIWGALAAKLNWRIYQITLENIQLCLPELEPPQQQSLAKHSLQETAKVVFETAKAWTLPISWTKKQFIKETNKHLLLNALDSNKTTIVLVPHLGNWEMFGAYLAWQKPMLAMYLPPANELHHQQIIKSREHLGMRMAPANRKGVMLVLKAAINGDFIGILPDQEPDTSSGQFAPFFNQPALTMTLIHKLLQRTECNVLMGYGKRTANGFEAVFREPDIGIFSADENVSLTGLNASIEACVRDIPEQYQWEYKRFKQHPSGEKKVHYRKHK